MNPLLNPLLFWEPWTLFLAKEKQRQEELSILAWKPVLLAEIGFDILTCLFFPLAVPVMDLLKQAQMENEQTRGVYRRVSDGKKGGYY